MFQTVKGKESLVSTGIDWLTATAARGTRGQLLETAAQTWTEQEARKGGKSELWNWNGYNGACIEGIQYGHRDDGHIIRLSGEMARVHAVTAASMADNVSRIDLQATFYQEGSNANYASLYAALLPEVPKIASGHTQMKLTAGMRDGQTLNIGNRTSDRFFRVYDKHVESKGLEPEGTWRFEVEYKNERAKRVAAHLVHVDGRLTEVLDILNRAFWDYQIVLPLQTIPKGFRDTSQRKLTDDHRRLLWLESSVGPMAQRLVKAGHGSEVYRAIFGWPLSDELTGLIKECMESLRE